MFSLSLTLLVVGSILAARLSMRSRVHRRAEALAGGLILSGLTLLGLGLPFFR